MIAYYFFDIPVYRVSPDSYEKEKKLYIDKNININEDLIEFYKRNLDRKASYIHHLEKKFGGVWIYNEIIGYIRLHFCGYQIRGEYFCNDVKRHVKTRNKQFTYRTHKLACELALPLKADNQYI